MNICLKILKSNKAFSIVEVMVAVGVVSVGMLGVTSLMLRNITVEPINKNNLIASMLAQEGLELIRNIRDSNWSDVANLSFDDGIFATSTVDIEGISELSTDWGAGSDLKLNGAGFYTHNGAISTPFKRMIVMASTTEYMNVRSIVRWSKNGKDYDYVAETYLYDWR